MRISIEEIKAGLKERREKVQSGETNSIPVIFERFRRSYQGIEQGRYYLVSASTKVGKTQITNFMFVYTVILYIWKEGWKVKPKIYYYSLEETPENITLRFISFCLWYLTGSKKRVDPKELKSTDSARILSEEVEQLMERKSFKELMEIYEEVIDFRVDIRNPTGIKKDLESYCISNGEVEYEEDEVTVTDEYNRRSIERRRRFKRYTPNDSKVYFIGIIDHIGLIAAESGMSLYDSIGRLSGYLKELRNRYNMIPVVIQQQNDQTTNLEAYKAGKIRPTRDGLRDNKQTGHDCDVMLGLCAPAMFELMSYKGYDISKFRDNIRFLEVVLNREGESNVIAPLYFDGAVNAFMELPRPEDSVALKHYYVMLDEQRKSKRGEA